MHNEPERRDGNDDVDVLGLVLSVWRQKFLVLFFVIMAVIFAICYLWIVKPIYEARIYVAPPSVSDIGDLNYGRTGASELTPFTVKQVFDGFMQHLRSGALARQFYEERVLSERAPYPDAATERAEYAAYLASIEIVQLPDNPGPRAYVVVRQANAEQAAVWARAFVERAGRSALKEFEEGAIKEARIKSDALHQQIQELRGMGVQLRNDKITRLNEALNVAGAIGLEVPGQEGRLILGEPRGDFARELSYVDGAKVLRAEITNLERRGSEDPFIENLRDLQVRQRLYDDIVEHRKDSAVYKLDGVVEVSSGPVKPRRVLVIGVAVVFGLGVGLFVALMRHTIRQFKAGVGRTG